MVPTDGIKSHKGQWTSSGTRSGVPHKECPFLCSLATGMWPHDLELLYFLWIDILAPSWGMQSQTQAPREQDHPRPSSVQVQRPACCGSQQTAWEPSYLPPLGWCQSGGPQAASDCTLGWSDWARCPRGTCVGMDLPRWPSAGGLLGFGFWSIAVKKTKELLRSWAQSDQGLV